MTNEYKAENVRAMTKEALADLVIRIAEEIKDSEDGNDTCLRIAQWLGIDCTTRR